ncbi:TIGR01777 family oxidoreductase [Marinomonas sp. IMCC 4694]|uniref:TIGR01777 family oxidoreductase n=1 Tax=Marinomonas sp. IMCC 4694 TaxID=2605432 RepID=UPI0011E60A08|nr:TIGR01777 family oxidoreductase [Marinomonas sp. IMCC 4694]TYL47853.1 TIGR01777 family protein [Marinomonas sp. IMCC 4694]
MNILVSGATGFIGQSLLKSLSPNEHNIYAVVRKIDTRLHSSVRQFTLETLSNIDKKIDVFINLAGENIASKPWTEKRKKHLYDSRVTLTDSVRLALQHPPSLVISMSAIGFYGVARHGVFSEDTPPKGGFSHELCKAWEDSAHAFLNDQTRIVIFRLGVVLGRGGALNKMRLPFKLGAGGPIAGGKQWFSWVHIDDVVNAITTAMRDQDYVGEYNLVAAELIEQQHFAKAYARSLNRPAVLPTPRWMLNAIFGEMACLLTEGAKIVPKRLEQQGFEFSFDTIEKALEDIENQ